MITNKGHFGEQRGLWAYSVENRADSHQGLYVQVTAKRNSSSGLHTRLWTSSGSRTINSSDPSSPVRLYAEVKVGVAPVMKARVVAKLLRLGTNTTGSNYRPIYLDLWDNGIGGECLILLCTVGITCRCKSHNMF